MNPYVSVPLKALQSLISVYERFEHVTCTLYPNKVCDWLEKQ